MTWCLCKCDGGCVARSFHRFDQLMEDDLSSVFHEPVDLEAYPSYSEKVDEPMDFGTIKSKLDSWEYRRNDPIGFQRDMRLVRGSVVVSRLKYIIYAVVLCVPISSICSHRQPA